MLATKTRFTLCLALGVSTAALFSACKGGSPEVGENGSGDGDAGDGDSGDGLDPSQFGNGDGDGDGADVSIAPAGSQILTVEIGEELPSVTFEATIEGNPVDVAWSVDRGDLATITLGESDTVVVTATGHAGGVVVVSAGYNGQIVTREIVIEIEGSQNGPDPSNPDQALQIPETVADLTAGGGPGGVGGEGLGTAISDDSLVEALGSPTESGADQNLSLVYPYDQTVFPRGMLAPLLAWDWTEGDADAVRLTLATESGSFRWEGAFGRPAILATSGDNFTQHPIPQDVWEMATNSASGESDKLVVTLTVAKDGIAYGPLPQTWVIADTRLSGTIYYNSYGTNLAKNHGGAVGGPLNPGQNTFGGATLGIRVGDTNPTLVAGGTGASETDTSYCRVCHSVSADGSMLVSAHHDGDNSAYLLNADGTTTETIMATGGLEFPGMYPDGSLALSQWGDLVELPGGAVASARADNGLGALADNVGTPMFSPDGSKLVFNPRNSMAIADVSQKILVADFDFATQTFSNEATVVDLSAEDAGVRPGWPAFFPDGESIVFHYQSAAGIDGTQLDLRTRKGARAQLYWGNLSNPNDVTPLDRLNGIDENGDSYLTPLSAPSPLTNCTGDTAQVGNIDTSHENDIELNYEPTVNPVAGGGYAWVVFTSRRRYANVATIPPFCSDPRGVDLIENVTPKKLWVAAVNLNAAPGEDASHPAFYLPGQELLAGNSRAFWVLDPCRDDGDSCETGDQCCNGFCQPDSEGELVCGSDPPDSSCSELQERCEAATDCCDSTNICIGGFCSPAVPR